MNRIISKYLFYYPVTLAKGEFIHRYLKTYEQFQFLSKKNIEEYQLHHLKKLIHHAINRSLFYKNHFLEISNLDINKLSDLSQLPALSKSNLVDNVRDLTTFDSTRFFSRKTTGGSTGQAVTLYKNADALARERAATWRSYRWAGIDIGDPQARFWGVPLHQTQRLKTRIIDLIANRKRLSAFEINDLTLKLYWKTLHSFKPKYLYGYVSMIESFCRFVDEQHLDLPNSVKSIITTSEVLTDQSRDYIEKTTGLKVFNEYGCGEIGSIAHECEHGSMHLMSDNLIVEIENSPDNTGELIVTDLFNYATPLIRYRLGDFATLSDKPCQCGRALPVLDKIHGRAYDLVTDSKGNQVHPELLMYIFEDFKEKHGGIIQFQVIQKKELSLLVNAVAEISLNKEIFESHIKKETKQRLGHPVFIQYVDEIPREKSGKIRLIKREY